MSRLWGPWFCAPPSAALMRARNSGVARTAPRARLSCRPPAPTSVERLEVWGVCLGALTGNQLGVLAWRARKWCLVSFGLCLRFLESMRSTANLSSSGIQRRRRPLESGPAGIGLVERRGLHGDFSCRCRQRQWSTQGSERFSAPQESERLCADCVGALRARIRSF